MKNNIKSLTRPMVDEEVNWRMDSLMQNGKRVRLLAYIDARSAMERLDEAVGQEGWSDDYLPGPNGGVMCKLSVCVDGTWVTKSDVAENTAIEAIKGGVSDAFKRACVKWGIGRNLYDLGNTIVDVQPNYPKGVASHYVVRVYSKRDGVKGYAVAPSIRDIMGIHTDSGAPDFEPAVTNGTPAPTETPLAQDPIVQEVIQELGATVVDVVPPKKGRVSKDDMLTVIGQIMRCHNLKGEEIGLFVYAITGTTYKAKELQESKWADVKRAFTAAKELSTVSAWVAKKAEFKAEVVVKHLQGEGSPNEGS